MRLRQLLPWLFPLLVTAQPQQLLQEWKASKALAGASYAYCVREQKSGTILGEYNSGTLLIPASTLKVLTTLAALDVLGKDFRFKTKLIHTGTFDAKTGILNGDLIIVGSGDPSLESENYSNEKAPVTDVWARALKDKGVKEIKGRIIGDASALERAVPEQWIWGDIANYFGAVPCGLTYKDNKFKLIFSTAESGSKAALTGTAPNYKQQPYNISCDVIAKGSEDEAYVYGDPFGWTKTVKGTLPPNQSRYEVEAALPDPALLCAEDLYQSLLKAGIRCPLQVVQSNYKNNDSLKGNTLYTHVSPGLESLIYFTNLKSNNLYCESLLMAMGKGSAKTGLAAVRKALTARGLSAEAYFMTDGSGLSRANTCTAAFQSELLCAAAKDSLVYRILKHSFPVAGKSGSMSNVGKGSGIENNMSAKTGYINRARAYCGYVKSRSGKELAFSVMLNNYNCSAREAKQYLEKLMLSFYEY